MALAALVIFICLFSYLGAVGLVGPDEPRYAWIARDMTATGDWVTPRLYEHPWFEKPILYYWTGAIGFDLHLPAEWAARLPSAIAALAVAFTLGWLGWRHYGTQRDLIESPALLAPLFFSSSVAAIGFARAATPDMLFSATLSLAMLAAASVLRRGSSLRSAQPIPEKETGSDFVSLACFGAFLGLSVLAKGPAGVVLAAGAVGIWATLTNRWRSAFRLAHPIAIAAFCVVALPWYVLCAQRNLNFIRVFLFEHNFERYTTPMFQHKQPFWFFGAILLLALLPWTLLLVPAVREGLSRWRDKSWADSPGFFFACWAIFPVLFFSFSQSKLPGYILPAIPPFALLLSATWVKLREARSRSLRWIQWGLGFSWVAIGISAAFWQRRLPAEAKDALGRPIFLCAVLAVAVGLLVIGLTIFHKHTAIPLSLFLVGALVISAGARILPVLDPYISARRHAAVLAQDRRPDRIFTYHLNRSWTFGLAFYLRREIPEWSASDPEAAFLLTTPRGLEELRKLGRFHGNLDEEFEGVLYVPVLPAPH